MLGARTSNWRYMPVSASLSQTVTRARPIFLWFGKCPPLLRITLGTSSLNRSRQPVSTFIKLATVRPDVIVLIIYCVDELLGYLFLIHHLETMRLIALSLMLLRMEAFLTSRMKRIYYSDGGSPVKTYLVKHLPDSAFPIELWQPGLIY